MGRVCYNLGFFFFKEIYTFILIHVQTFTGRTHEKLIRTVSEEVTRELVCCGQREIYLFTVHPVYFY